MNRHRKEEKCQAWASSYTTITYIMVMGQNFKKKKNGLEDQNLFTDGNMCNYVLV